MIGSDTNEVIENLFRSLLQRYQENLGAKMRVQSLFLMALICCIMILIK